MNSCNNLKRNYQTSPLQSGTAIIPWKYITCKNTSNKLTWSKISDDKTSKAWNAASVMSSQSKQSRLQVVTCCSARPIACSPTSVMRTHPQELKVTLDGYCKAAARARSTTSLMFLHGEKLRPTHLLHCVNDRMKPCISNFLRDPQLIAYTHVKKKQIDNRCDPIHS